MDSFCTARGFVGSNIQRMAAAPDIDSSFKFLIQSNRTSRNFLYEIQWKGLLREFVAILIQFIARTSIGSPWAEGHYRKKKLDTLKIQAERGHHVGYKIGIHRHYSGVVGFGLDCPPLR